MNDQTKKKKTAGNVIQFPGAKKPVPSSEPATFKGFHIAAVSEDLDVAASMLAEIFEIPLDAAKLSAGFYAKKVKEDDSHLVRTMLLRAEIKTGLVNTVLILLRECFGLEGPNALQAYNSLKSASLRDGQ